MKVNGEIKEGTSKNGNKYYYISVKLTPTYEKKVFLDNAELELIKLILNNDNNK